MGLIIDRMNPKGTTWENKVMIFAMAQMMGKYVVTYVRGYREWHCTSGMIKKSTKCIIPYVTVIKIIN